MMVGLMDRYSFFNIPDESYIGTTIYKKHFYDNATLSSSDKMLFKNNINRITWLYCLKPNLINIAAYKDDERDYPELEVIEVILNKDNKLDRIAEVIMRTIPYPMILVFNLNNKLKIYTAHQKISQKDNSKNTLEEFVLTDWLEEGDSLFKKLDIKRMNFTNFYLLYSDIMDTISVYSLSEVIKKDISSIGGKEAREVLNENQNIEDEISSLKLKLKNESQFNRKMELNIAIKELMKRKEEILEDIK